MAEKKLIVTVGANTNDFNKKMMAMQKNFNSLSRRFDKTFGPIKEAIGTGLKVAAAAGAAGLGVLVASGVKANAQMEQYRATLDTVMKDTQKAGETLDWVKQYAKDTPFELPGLVESAVKLEALGLETKKFMPAVGDMAAVFASSGKTVQDAAEAMTDAAMGEFERLKEFGIKLGADDFKAGGKYAGVAYADAVMQEIKNKNYSGAAEALSKTFLGRLSTLKDSAGEIIQKTMAPVFERISAGMGGLVEKVDQLKNNPSFQEFTQKFSAGLLTVWDAASKVGSVIIGIAGGIMDNWKYIEPILAGMAVAFVALKVHAAAMAVKLAAMTAAQWALNTAMGANPLGLIVIGIGALVAAGVALYQNWDTVKAKAGDLWNSLANSFTGIKNSVVNTSTEVWDRIKYVVEAVGGIITGLFLPRMAVLATTTAIHAAKVIASWVAMEAQVIATGVVHAVKVAPQIIASFASMAASATINAAKVVAGWVLMGAQATIQAAKMAAAWVVAMGPIAWISASVVGIATLVIANWETIKAKTVEIWTSISSNIYEIGQNIVLGLIDGMTSLLKKARDAAVNIAESVRDGIKNLLGIHSPSVVLYEIGAQIEGEDKERALLAVWRVQATLAGLGVVPA